MATAQEIADAHACTELCTEPGSTYLAIGSDGEEIVLHENMPEAEE